jgi:hypothetical protein
MYAYLSRWALPLISLSFVYACASQAAKSAERSGPAVPIVMAAYDVTGIWQGRSFADCPIITMTNSGRCGAMQQISFTMFQSGQAVTGSYTCAFGNENCRDLEETGVIRNGQITNRLLRLVVMLGDGSMCRFTGMPQNDILQGRYQCHWGGPMERGGFRVERSY